MAFKSREFIEVLSFIANAHENFSNSPEMAYRSHDNLTPYFVHPIWCASMLLQEPELPFHLRQSGAIALLCHDVLEDTTSDLPAVVTNEIAALIKGLTFQSFEHEVQELWDRPNEVKLLKLYDKVSNLLDGTWMKLPKLEIYREHTSKLAEQVNQTFGQINIVRLAFAISSVSTTVVGSAKG